MPVTGLSRLPFRLPPRRMNHENAESRRTHPGMELNTPPKPIPVPNLEQLQVLEGYYAWRRGEPEAKQ
jgi:hypothetical protein